MNFLIITKNHAADTKIRPPKIDFRAVGTHESHSTAWELKITGGDRSMVQKRALSMVQKWVVSMVQPSDFQQIFFGKGLSRWYN